MGVVPLHVLGDDGAKVGVDPVVTAQTPFGHACRALPSRTASPNLDVLGAVMTARRPKRALS